MHAAYLLGIDIGKQAVRWKTREREQVQRELVETNRVESKMKR